MSDRQLVALGMIAVLVLAGAVWLWLGWLRGYLRARFAQRRSERARRAATAGHIRPQPALRPD